jgi:hypothetical protein
VRRDRLEVLIVVIEIVTPEVGAGAERLPERRDATALTNWFAGPTEEHVASVLPRLDARSGQCTE